MAKMNMEQLKRKMDRWRRTAPERLAKYIKKGAMIITKEVKEQHLSGPKMPRGIGDLLHATLRVISGRLRGSITEKVSVSKDSVRASIGTNVFYGRKHERGEEGMPERPFLRPSIMEKKPQFVELVLRGMMEAYKKSG